jgi:glycosyltransferase involved in cell wall biosynthesis
MRIGIDAHMVGSRETGNETYVVQLARALSDVAGSDEVMALTTGAPSVAPLLASAGTLRVMPVLPDSSVRRLLFTLPRQARALGLDVLHASYIAPLRSPCPIVLSVHDISYRSHPEAFSLRDRILLGRMIPISLRRAKRVITLSESSRRDIIHSYRVSPQKVVVTPLAAAPGFGQTTPEQQRAVQQRLGITTPYLLSVGNVQPRKNLARLVRAFSALTETHSEPLELVIAGPDKYRADLLRQEIETARVADRVRLVGYVPDADLAPLYGGALAFVYPSLYEGFGLPVLEAMACGTPVVCSNTSSLPEVAGDAALLVSPTDTRAIARALTQLVDSAHLRAEMRIRSLANAARFSWKRTAGLTLDVYRQATEQAIRSGIRA